jgi:hypothetical protein
VLRGFLRIIAYSLLFWFIYRVVVGALRYLTHSSSGEKEPSPRSPNETNNERQPDYRDVKDASFKDLPKDDSKPS